MQAILIALAACSLVGFYKGIRAAWPLWKQGQRGGIYCWLLLMLAGVPLQGVMYRLQAENPNMWLASTLLLITLVWCLAGFPLMVYAKKRLEGAEAAIWPDGKNGWRVWAYAGVLAGALVFWVLGFRGLFAGGQYEGVLVVLILYLVVIGGRGLCKCYHTYRYQQAERRRELEQATQKKRK